MELIWYYLLFIIGSTGLSLSSRDDMIYLVTSVLMVAWSVNSIIDIKIKNAKSNSED
jgi:hypothetical protein